MKPFSNRLLFALALALLIAVLALARACSKRQLPAAAPATGGGAVASRELADQFAALEAREQKADATVWAKEMLAQQCGRAFEVLWDSLNAATNKLSVAASFPVGQIVLGEFQPPQTLPHGITLRTPAGHGPTLATGEWRRRVEEWARAGWQLAQTEFRHNRFDTDDSGRPRQSHFYFSAHLIHPARSERALLEGDLIVDWGAKPPGQAPAAVNRIDASHLTLKTRHGEPLLEPILAETITPPRELYFIDPLLLYDLDGDGLSEIILAGSNLVYRRRREGGYQREPLCQHSPGLISTALIADLDRDGFADFLCAGAEGLFLFQGSQAGTFAEPGRLVWPARPRLQTAMVLTCGDIDHDGDLDLFLGQYKVPTLSQLLEPHYYDANDGHPACLLLNDGHGRFSDATAAAGLERNRWRRTFSASFVDLNGDGHLDLLVVSDFAGADLYRNNGRGQFTDVTSEWVTDPHAFGMAHALADFNADGRLDCLMIGMNSPTADRLEHLGLTRPAAHQDPTMRRRMTFGNRLWLARPAGGFEQTPLNEALAHTGWSWGCSAFDFDNDSFPDVYIANGHQTKASVRDYEPEFWLHDIFVDDTIADTAASAYFLAKFGRTRGQGWSYGGYEKNRLYLNQRGESFVEIAHLAGVALEADCRNVVADDLDGDGRLDLLVTTFEVWPTVRQTLRVYRNTQREGGHWIGFRFREEGGGPSPVGVRVMLEGGGLHAVRDLVTGDSFRSQHANTVHFGLGQATRVETVEIRWPDGQTVTLRDPVPDQYHTVRAPGKSPIRR